MKLYKTDTSPFSMNPALVLAKNKKQAREFVKEDSGKDLEVFEVTDIKIPCKLFRHNNY